MRSGGALLLALLLLVPAVVAAAEPAPDRIRRVRVVGPGGAHVAAIRRVTDRLVGEVPDRDRLVATVRALEGVPGVGTVAVLVQSEADGPVLVVTYDDVPRRVAHVRYVVDRGRLDEGDGWRLARRIDAASDGLLLWAGERFHPYFVGLDRETVLRFYRDRGHRDVRVAVAPIFEGALADLEVQVTRGPLYRVEAVALDGFPPGITGGRLDIGAALAQRSVEAERKRLERALCRLGHARASVAVTDRPLPGEQTDDVRRVEVRFAATPGPVVRVGRVQVAGRRVPWPIISTLPLVEGGPYCALDVEATRERLAEHLRDHGVPDPRIVVHERTRLLPDGQRRTSVTFDIRSLEQSVVERIWFTGNTVTQREVLAHLTAVAEGDVYRQSDVDRSVQAMRRSGLFQEVDVRVIEGSRPDRVFLSFRLVERKLVSVDVVARRVSLHNMDVTAWPSDYEALELGQAFRGAGQRLDLFGHPDRIGLGWRDDFIGRWFLARGALLRREANSDAFEEVWYAFDVGGGVQVFENALSAVLFGEAEWTFTDQVKGADLPVLDGDAVTLAGGLEGRFDFNRRDEERIPYLGLDGSLRGRAGLSVYGPDFRWWDTVAELRAHVPLWQTRRLQHYVLRLRARSRAVFAAEKGRLQAHQRLFPGARGYTGSGIGLDFDFDDDDTVRLGGLHAAEGSVELRVPLPFGRRNALSPFFDVAFVSDDLEHLLQESFAAPGLAATFSLFDERLEGTLWAAWPLRDDAAHEYVGASVGGNF